MDLTLASRRTRLGVIVLFGLGGCFNPEPSPFPEGTSTGSPPPQTQTDPGSTSSETDPGSTSAGSSSGVIDGSSDGPPPTCGDGVVDDGEECDDGNDDDTDGCLAGCVLATCGDGQVWVGNELCDDAGESATCDVDCTAVLCGDGVMNATAGEECDDGNDSDTDACIAGCVAATCGDGIVWEGTEECDDGNLDDTDACVGMCTNATCGDGSVWAGTEECDDGNAVDDDECSNQCLLTPRIIFISSQLYTGNFGGLAGADAECQALAMAAGLPGTYLAWLSTAMESPSTRMTQAPVPYLRPDGVQVAPDWAGLTDGDIDVPINVTETGGPAPIGNNGCGGGGMPTVWTGTNSNGTAGGTNCMDWASEDGGSYWGNASLTNGSWSGWCSGGTCTWTSALYCVQQ